MAATPLPASTTSLPAERFFRGSLFFLVLTSAATLVSAGNLDLITCILVPAAMLYKGVRWWDGKPPELSHTAGTWLVISSLAVFPLDVFIFSRSFVTGSSNPALLAGLLGAVHFLLFVMLARLYSATSDRDALFLAMLAFAAILASCILTIDTSFLALFFIFLLFGVATFIALEVRRGARGTITPPFTAHSLQERRLGRALGLAAPQHGTSRFPSAHGLGRDLHSRQHSCSTGDFLRRGLRQQLYPPRFHRFALQPISQLLRRALRRSLAFDGARCFQAARGLRLFQRSECRVSAAPRFARPAHSAFGPADHRASGHYVRQSGSRR